MTREVRGLLNRILLAEWLRHRVMPDSTVKHA
jgi:hypothetical protein